MWLLLVCEFLTFGHASFFVLFIAWLGLFSGNKKKSGFINSAKEFTFTNFICIWFDFINCAKNVTRFVNIKREACHFTDRCTLIMRTCVSSCCHTLSVASVCGRVTLHGCISLLRWLVCCTNQVPVCQDEEGEQHTSGRVGSKAKSDT